MGARAGGTLGKDPWSPGVGSDRDLPSRSILRGLRLEPLLGLWLRRADRFGEWPPARGGRGKGEEVVNGKKWSSRANLKELGRISTTKFPAGQSRAQLGEGAVGVRTACCVSLCGLACRVLEKLSLGWNCRNQEWRPWSHIPD